MSLSLKPQIQDLWIEGPSCICLNRNDFVLFKSHQGSSHKDVTQGAILTWRCTRAVLLHWASTVANVLLGAPALRIRSRKQQQHIAGGGTPISCAGQVPCQGCARGGRKA